MTGFREGEHPRHPAGSSRGGEFRSKAGGSGGKKLSDRAKRALASHKPSTNAVQRKARDEADWVCRIIGAEHTDDHEAVDAVLKHKGDKIGIEIKVLIHNSNDKITMHPSSRERKERWARSNRARLMTVVCDVRSGTRAIYVRHGVGSFRLVNLTQVESIAMLHRIARTGR